MQLAFHAGIPRRLISGQIERDERDRQSADQAVDEEHHAPTQHFAKQRHRGSANQRCDGEAKHHVTHRLRASLERRQRGRHQRRDAKVSAVRQACEKAHGDQRANARRRRAEEIADREDRHQDQQQRTARELCRRNRNHRRAHDDADCVSGDRIACGRHACVETRRHLGQQAHDREFADADAKRAARERQNDERRLPMGRRRGCARRADVLSGQKAGPFWIF